MKQNAIAYFNRKGVMFIITAEGTKHRFTSVSRGVDWCKENNVSAHFKR